MVGRLSLQDVPELVDTKKKGDGVLDSPDSGLPPSPSPSHWGPAAAGGGGGGERTPAPGALEPDAAATPAAPVSGPALVLLPGPPALGTTSRRSGPLRARCRRPHPPVGTAWPSPGAGGGSAAEPGQLEPVAGKLSSPGRRGSPGEASRRLLPSGWRPPGAAGLLLGHILARAGWRGTLDTGREPQPSPYCGLAPPLPGACPFLVVLGRGMCSGSRFPESKRDQPLGTTLVALEGDFGEALPHEPPGSWWLCLCHLTRVQHAMGGRPLGGLFNFKNCV